MSFRDLLTDTCVIQTRTVVTTGMTDTETWVAQSVPVPCRKLTRSAVRGNVEKAQHATLLLVRFALPLSAAVSLRDRIAHGGRVYPVLEILTPGRTAHHQVAVCEAVAGAA